MVWLRSLYTIVLIFFCTNLGLSLFNIIKYVYPMKERSKLILLFYGLILVSNVCYITIYIHLDITPRKSDPFQLRVSGSMCLYDVLAMIGSLSMLALGWLRTLDGLSGMASDRHNVPTDAFYTRHFLS